MASQDTGKGWIESTFGPAWARAGDYSGRLTRWSADHLPGGAKTFWAATGLASLALAIWTIYPSSRMQRPGAEFGGPMPVAVSAVARGDIAIALNALGTVTPLATVTVRPQVSGPIVRFHFREGQMVRAGDLLAEIDPRPYRAALDQAKGQLERDRATLANAEVDLNRDRALYAQKAVSDQVYATQQALVRSTAATVKADEAAVEAAAINLGYTRIAAPVAGRVGLRQVDPGNLVQAGQANGIVVVTQLQPISVIFSLPEDDIAEVASALRAGRKLSVEAYDRAQSAKVADGTLATLDNVIDPTTGTVKLRAMFENPKDELFPNQFVNVRLLVRTLRGQIWAPASAIERGSQGSYVYVVQPDGTVAMRAVTLGPQDGERVAILKGLNAGERVVTEGADRLHDGAEVSVAQGPRVSSSGPPAGTAEAGSSDARRARRAAVIEACGGDIKKLCSDEDGFGAMRCLRQNTDALSGQCRAVLSRMRRGGPGGR
jgi:multidrug efflux system membrane fusion protein